MSACIHKTPYLCHKNVPQDSLPVSAADAAAVAAEAAAVAVVGEAAPCSFLVCVCNLGECRGQSSARG